MKITLEILWPILVGIVGVAQGVLASVRVIEELKNNKVETEQLLLDLQHELTTGETWERLNEQPVDDKYLILTYERVIIKFMLLKKIAKENSPVILSIIRNVHNIDGLISSEYKDPKNVNEYAKIYRNSHKDLINKIERINKKIPIVSDFYSTKYTEIAILQTIMGERLLKMLDFSDVQNVLDFGCGDGRHAITIATRYPTIQVDGFDAATDLITLANKKRREAGISNTRFWIDDVNNFDSENAYNIIFCNYLIHWVGPQCFKIAYNALKNGGQFVASISGEGASGEGSTPELRKVIWQKIEKLGYDKYFQNWNDTRYNPSQEIVERELRKAGFTEFEIVTEKYNDIDLDIGKTPKQKYEAELETTLPPYYSKLRTAKERKTLYHSILSCLIDEATPINSVDIVLKAKK